MSRLDIAWASDSGTQEIASAYKGRPLSDLPTEPIPVIALKPAVHPVRRTIPIRVRGGVLLTLATVGAGVMHLLAGGVF